HGLDEIRPEKERVPRPERTPDLREELARGGSIEVADVRPEEEDERAPPGRPLAGGSPEPLLVRRAVPDDRDVLERAEGALRELERGRRYVDEVDRHPPAAAPRRFGEQGDLLAAPGPELEQGHRVTERSNHLVRRPGEQARLRARDPIPGQPADRLEERRTERVVEVLRLDLFGREREVPR